jgi:hypothetical protein
MPCTDARLTKKRAECDASLSAMKSSQSSQEQLASILVLSLLLFGGGASACSKKKLPMVFAPVRNVATTGKIIEGSGDKESLYAEIEHPRPPSAAMWIEKYKLELDRENWNLVGDRVTATDCDYNSHDRESSCVETVYRRGRVEENSGQYIHVTIYEPHGAQYEKVVIVRLDVGNQTNDGQGEWKRPPHPK